MSDGSRSGPHSARQRDEDRLLLHYALGKAYLNIRERAARLSPENQGSRRKRATFNSGAVSAH